jgi:hypothetical protein
MFILHVYIRYLLDPEVLSQEVFGCNYVEYDEYDNLAS